MLVVIIAVALLAFILGDLITNGRNLFGNDTTVAKVGGEKIDYTELQRKEQELSATQQGSDNNMLPHMALQQIMGEKLMDSAMEPLDFKPVSPEVLRFYMIENPTLIQEELSSLLMRMAQSGIQFNSIESAHNALFNSNQNNPQIENFRNEWIALENLCQTRIGQYVFTTVFQNSFKANDLDIAALKRDNATASSVTVARKPFSQADLESYTASDADLQKAYDTRKEMFKVEEPTKEVSLIAYQITPSAKDQQASMALASKVQGELKEGNLSKDSRREGVEMKRFTQKYSDVGNYTLQMALEQTPAGETVVVENNATGFQVARVNDKQEMEGEVFVAKIQVNGNTVKAEDVLAYANSGESLDSIASKFPGGNVRYIAPAKTSVVSNGAPTYLELGQAKFDELKANPGKYYIVSEDEQGALIEAITELVAPEEYVSYDLASYRVVPSDATIAAEKERLQKYISQNSTAVKFADNAQAAGYQTVELDLSASDPAIPMGGNNYYPDSRSIVRWVVMDAKEGDVSKVYQSRNLSNPTLYAVGVLSSFDEYVPVNNRAVKRVLTDQVKREKAGDAYAKKYVKGTLDETAQAMEVEPIEVAAITAGAPSMEVMDNKAKGRILGSQANGKMQVAKGDDGIYVYVVNGVADQGVSVPDEQLANEFITLHRINPMKLFGHKKKIENNVYKFEQGE